MIERLLDHFEGMMAQQYGETIYHRGPFSLWGSFFNAVVSGILVVAGLVGVISRLETFFIVFILVAATLHAFFLLVAVRVYNGRTLYDRELAAQLEEEESAADELPPR